jgi:hypothetical protein
MINYDRKPAMHNPVSVNQSQPAAPRENATKPRASAGEADAFNACMRKNLDQSAKSNGDPEKAKDMKKYAGEGKAKESGAHNDKKYAKGDVKGTEYGKDMKKYAGEGKAKESGAHNDKKYARDGGKGKDYGKDMKKHAGEGKAKESGAHNDKKKAKGQDNDNVTILHREGNDKKPARNLLDESIPVFVDDHGVQREYGKPHGHG